MPSVDAGLLEVPAVKLLAEVHRITPAQLLLHWGMQRGCSVIPRSSSTVHIEEIAECAMADVAEHGANTLEASEWATLDSIRQHRQIDATDVLSATSTQTGSTAIRSLAELWEEEEEKEEEKEEEEKEEEEQEEQEEQEQEKEAA
jgi:hypothetical protein